MSVKSDKNLVTISTLKSLKEKGEKFACLTAYEATLAEKISNSGVEVILVGDSLGMVIQGNDSTLPVTMDHLIYHLQCVVKGNVNSHIMADMPFMSYSTDYLALENATKLMQNGAHSVKIEGGTWICKMTSILAERGIPVCAHMGLTPQSINKSDTSIFFSTTSAVNNLTVRIFSKGSSTILSVCLIFIIFD